MHLKRELKEAEPPNGTGVPFTDASKERIESKIRSALWVISQADASKERIERRVFAIWLLIVILKDASKERIESQFFQLRLQWLSVI